MQSHSSSHDPGDEKPNAQLIGSPFQPYQSESLKISSEVKPEKFSGMLSLKNGYLLAIFDGYVFSKHLLTGEVTKSINTLPTWHLSRLIKEEVDSSNIKELPDGSVLIACTSYIWSRAENSLFTSRKQWGFIRCELYQYDVKRKELSRQTALEKQGIDISSITIVNGKEFACIDKNRNICQYHCDDLTKPTFIMEKCNANTLVVLDSGRFIVAKCSTFRGSYFSIYKRSANGYKHLNFNLEDNYCEGYLSQLSPVNESMFVEVLNSNHHLLVSIWEFSSDETLRKKNSIHITLRTEQDRGGNFNIFLFPDKETLLVQGNPAAIPGFYDVDGKIMGHVTNWANYMPSYFVNIKTLEFFLSEELSFKMTGPHKYPLRSTFFAGENIATSLPTGNFSGGNIINWDYQDGFTLHRFPFYSSKMIQAKILDTTQTFMPPIARIISEYAAGSICFFKKKEKKEDAPQRKLSFSSP